MMLCNCCILARFGRDKASEGAAISMVHIAVRILRFCFYSNHDIE